MWGLKLKKLQTTKFHFNGGDVLIKSFWGTGPAVDEDCNICGLYHGLKNPFTCTYGKGKLNALIVTTKPSSMEDLKGNGFSGEPVASLSEYFSKLGINLENNFYKTSATGCYHKGETTEASLFRCKKKLIKEIGKCKPKHIITVGAASTKSVIGHMFKMADISTLCFRSIPVHEYNAWVYPILDPSKLSTPNEKAYFSRLVKYVLSQIKEDKPLIKVNPFEFVTTLVKGEDVINGLNTLLDGSNFVSAFDTETTGLKPQYKYQEIVTMAIATREGSIAFPLNHNEDTHTDAEYKEITSLVKEYLTRKDIGKIAHNIQFDTMWTEVFFRRRVNGWLACTLTNQHLIDHRTGAKGLKDIAFLRWGIRDYDAKTKGYIESVESGAKAMNRMREMSLHEQLLYVGADAYLTLKLSDEHDKEYAESSNTKKHYPRTLFLQSNRTLCTMQCNGVPVDSAHYLAAEKEITQKINKLEKDISSDPSCLEFSKFFRKNFEHSVVQDLKNLLFNILKLDKNRVGTTESGEISLDEKALKEFDLPILDNILSLRKLLKIRDTYLAQYMREEVDGRVYPFFSIAKPRSYRSSSHSPNFQNLPKRDDYAKKLVRRGMITDKGFGIGEIDFSGVEVCTSAAYHKDPTFIDYLTVPGSDMHRDNTCDLWKISKDQVAKKLRFYTKNMWTFPQFYGDYFGSCAPQLWETCINKEKFVLPDGTPLIEHIHSKGIHTLKEFTEHCKKVEDKMWNERFPVYTQWKKDINDFYVKHGYVETYLGFRYTGLMDKKQTTNYPIQGTAFHILLWSINHIQDFITRNKLKSYLCGQIHDSCIFQWHPEEKDFLLTEMQKICSEDVRKEFEWINVPFGIDVELSAINGNFAEMKQHKLVNGIWSPLTN